MRISGTGSAAMWPGALGMGAGAGGQMDAVSKDLQKQIENLQEQLRELPSNQNMPMEAKMKKRQELQQQISALEVQLRQHQMEVQRELRQKKQEGGNEIDEMTGAKRQTKQKDGQNTGLSAGSMEALISADASVKQAGVHGSVARSLEGKAGVLEAEIKQDKGGPADASAAKEEELAKVKEAAEHATASQMENLAQANETLQTAPKDEENADETKKADDKSKTAPGADGDRGQADGIVKGGESGEEEDAQENTFDVELPGVAFSRGYNPVDVKL